MQDGHPVPAHRFDQCLGQTFAAGPEQAEGRPVDRAPKQFPDRYVEGGGCFLEQNVAGVDRVSFLHPMQAVDHRAVFDHDPFRPARGTRRVNDIGEIVRAGRPTRESSAGPEENSGVSRSIPVSPAGTLAEVAGWWSTMPTPAFSRT